MKAIIVTDLHFGVRKNSPFYMKKQLEWIDKQFLPTVDEVQPDMIINLGDCFDNRRTVDINILQTFNDKFFGEIAERGIPHYITLGNHDCYYKDNNDVSIVGSIFKDNPDIKIIKDNQKINLGDKKVLLSAWLANQEMQSNLQEHLSSSSYDYIMGHFQIIGSPMNGGQVCDNGTNPSIFKKTKVLSGHFHNPSETKNIWYIGNPFYTSWSDYEAKKGFYVYDSEDDSFTHIPTEDKVFYTFNFTKDNSSKVENLEEKVISITIDEKLDDIRKNELSNLINTLTSKNNQVETINNYLEESEQLTKIIDYKKHKEVSSMDFISEVINKMDVENKSQLIEYFQQLNSQIKGEEE